MDPERVRLAISVLDLTDLGDDTMAEDVAALSDRAIGAGTAAVCVWPRFVGDCSRLLAGSGVRVATVVNFPSGDEAMDAVMAMTREALEAGADEIDVVAPYRAWLAGDEPAACAVLDGVRAAVDAAGEDRLMKVIIETGELPNRAAIDRATHLAIGCGADFVKTSTGKTAVSATLEAAEIVLEAIDVSGRPVGFKASGGIRTTADAAAYIDLAEQIMGDGWVSPDTFRFGASGLLDALLAELDESAGSTGSAIGDSY
ncbi:MAG: deoxyribose-phosphate aldolase [Actinomycetota bacterium]|nr:deoxyribose-phosphate aldolase [Actinomycetota bacterium]